MTSTSSAHSGSHRGVGVTHRYTRKGLQSIAIRPVELPPDAHVHAVVQVDRAPFVRAGTRVSPGSPAAGVFRKPLPIDVSCAAADPFVQLTPAQRPVHRHSGLEIRIGVVLPEADDLPVVDGRADRHRRAGWRDGQVQFHRLTCLIDTEQADTVGIGQQFSVVVAARRPHHRAGAAF